MNKLYLMILGIFLFSFASAGLQIEAPENITVQKDYQIPKIIELNITNTENFDFYNLKFEQDILSIDPINITSGQKITIPARIITNTPFEGELILRGEYQRNVGSSNKTEEVRINYNYGLDKCDLELTQGDKIKWINEISDEVTLYNTDTEQDFKTILDNDNYTKNFSDPTTLNYLVKRNGAGFTTTCRIEVNPDTGLVHSSEYDAKINADIKIVYDPTELVLDYIESNYTLEYNEQKDDLLKIRNSGSNVAKDIKLNAEWFTFDENNFDLNSGATKTISYEINPEIFETNQTNKTHEILLTIEGNFPTINHTFNIFVPYKKLDTTFLDGNVDDEVITNFFKFWCRENPDSEVCISQSSNLTGSSPTIEITYDSIKALIEGNAEIKDELTSYVKTDLEFKSNQTAVDQNQSKEIAELKEALKEQNKSSDEQASAVKFAVIFLFSITLIVVGIAWYFKHGFKKRGKLNSSMSKGEQFY